MSLVWIAAVSLGFSHNGMCTSTALYHSSMLLLPCRKAVHKLNLAWAALDCGLQKSSNLDYMVCNVTSSVRRFHEIYISSPASPDHWITFLHLALSWRIANLQSRIIPPLYHLSMLLLPCRKAVNRLNLAQTALDCGLQKSLNLDYMVCNVTSSVGRFHEIYISSPASPDHWITFLHLALSWRIANSQSRIFSHFILYLMNLEWSASSMVQSIFGPST